MRVFARLRPLFFVAALSMPLYVSGCTGRASRPDADILGNGFKNAIRGMAAGRAFDQAVLALRRDDDTGFLQAIERLKRAGTPQSIQWARDLTLSRASAAVQRGWYYEMMAQGQPNAKKKWEERAMEKYRLALKMAPDFPSQSSILLNQLGYPLADRGTTTEDFQNAEKLTRRAVELEEKEIARRQSGSSAGQENIGDLRRKQAAGPRDSLAWALFKLRRYDEALRESERAIADVKANPPSSLLGRMEPDSLPELLYHLGAIHAALGHKEKARAAFDEALSRQPDHALAKAARAAL